MPSIGVKLAESVLESEISLLVPVFSSNRYSLRLKSVKRNLGILRTANLPGILNYTCGS